MNVSEKLRLLAGALDELLPPNMQSCRLDGGEPESVAKILLEAADALDAVPEKRGPGRPKATGKGFLDIRTPPPATSDDENAS